VAGIVHAELALPASDSLAVEITKPIRKRGSKHIPQIGKEYQNQYNKY